GFPLDAPVQVSRSTLLSRFPARRSCPGFPLDAPVQVSRSTLPSRFTAQRSRPGFPLNAPVQVSRSTLPSRFPARRSGSTYLTPVLASPIPHNRLQFRGVGSHIDEPSWRRFYAYTEEPVAQIFVTTRHKVLSSYPAN
ncbi:MAG: hypothetical protein RIS36_1633, partial [Pseudomonadota bacterium]